MQKQEAISTLIGTVVVDAASGGQFTAINQAISYEQTFAQPTVLIKAGTYNEVLSVLGISTVTIIGESSTVNDHAKNLLTLSNTTTPMSINTDKGKGITWININFVNTATGIAAAVSLRGTKYVFYNCQFISSGSTTINSTLGITIIANSYVPPAGAMLVSVGGSVSGLFSNLTVALACLPSDTTSQTIFIYPEPYPEQVSINRPGPVTIIGYQSGNVGQHTRETKSRSHFPVFLWLFLHWLATHSPHW